MGDKLGKALDIIRESAKKTNIKLHKLAGQCDANPDLEDIKNATELAEKRINTALKFGRLLQNESSVFNTLSVANQGLGALTKSLSEIKDICIDLKAVGDIYEALNTLDDDLILKNPEASAKAFGQMFVGFGRLFRFLPPPVSSWGNFFANAGDFFSNVSRGLSPQHVGGIARQWKEVDWEYAGGAGGR